MTTFKIGLTVENNFNEKYKNRSLLFSNGFNQNCYFLFELYKLCGHTPFWVSHENKEDNSNVIAYKDVTNENTDIIVELQIPIENTHLPNYSGPVVTIVFGAQLQLDMEQIVHGTIYKDYHKDSYNRYPGKSAIWLTPQHLQSLNTGYYLEELHNCPSYEAPFLWSSINCPDPFTNMDFENMKGPMNIVIMEPNINMGKNSLIPMMIVNNLWKRNPDAFKMCWVITNNQFQTTSYFHNNILKMLPCFHGHQNKTTFSKRANLKDIKSTFNNEPFVMLSYQNSWDLNYTFTEALHCKIPLIHNSPALNKEGVGYYYNDTNIKMGSQQLEYALTNGIPDDYSHYLNSCSITNSVNQHKYTALIEQELKKNVKKTSFLPKIVETHDFCAVLNSKDINEYIEVDANESFPEKQIKSFIIASSEERKKHMKQQIEYNYEFLKDIQMFEKNEIHKSKQKKLFTNHINCWKQAIEEKLDEAFIFEDDVLIIKNWRSIISEFINNQQPDIVKFDSLPYQIFDDANKQNNIRFYNNTTWACTGGYYITKQAMECGIKLFDKHNGTEMCIDEISKSFSAFTSTPRLCIQDWYTNKFSTTLQNDEHMKKLKNMQEKHYIPQYGHYYNTCTTNEHDKNKLLELKLNKLENKFGGLQQNIQRTNKSPYENNYYTVHQGGDRMNSVYHKYSKIYSKYMLPFVHEHINIAEVGILNGIGLAIWCDIFDSSTVHGYDIDTSVCYENLPNLKSRNAFEQNSPVLFEFDQFVDNRKYIESIIQSEKYKIVMDDGCHLDTAILQTFKSFLPYLEEEFIYFIEDNISVHKTIKEMYPEYNVFYENQMTVITSSSNLLIIKDELKNSKDNIICYGKKQQINIIYFDNNNIFEHQWLQELFTSTNEIQYDFCNYDTNRKYENPILVVTNKYETYKEKVKTFIDKEFMIVHLGDEFLTHDTDLYTHENCKHVFRNYIKPELQMKNLTYFPLGYKYDFDKHKPNLERKYIWSFCGDVNKHTRKYTLSQLKDIEPNYIHEYSGWNSINSLSTFEYQNILVQTKIIPCLAGNKSVDSFRICEALESGCVPILINKDKYFDELFGSNHPIPTVEEVNDMHSKILEINEIWETKRKEVTEWYSSYKTELKDKINKKIKKSQIDVCETNRSVLNTIFDKIYVINLKKDIQKKNNMIRKLDKLQVQYEVIEAILGKDFQDEFDKLDNNKYLQYKGEYGLWLTWKKLFKTIIDNNIEKVLIFEDDVYFHKEFNNNLKTYFDNLSQSWDICLLGSLDFKCESNCKSLNNFWYNPAEHVYGAMGIGLTQKAVKEILQKLNNNIYEPVDWLYKNQIKNTYVAFPPLIIANITKSSTNENNWDFEECIRLQKIFRQTVSDYDEIDFMKPKKTLNIAYVNCWEDKRVDNYFNKFIEINLDCKVNVCSFTMPHDILFCSVFGEDIMKNNFVTLEQIKQSNTKLKIFFSGENLDKEKHTFWKNNLNYFDICIGFEDTNIQSNICRFPLWLIYYKYYKYNEDSNILNYIQNEYNKNTMTTKTIFSTCIASHDNGGQRTFITDIIEKIKPNSCIYPSKFKKNYKQLSNEVCHKIEFLKSCIFSVCPENTSSEFYCTEKIFHAFESGNIPIYWGGNVPEKNILNENKYIFCNINENDEKNIKDAVSNFEQYYEGNIFKSCSKYVIDHYYKTVAIQIQTKLNMIFPQKIYGISYASKTFKDRYHNIQKQGIESSFFDEFKCCNEDDIDIQFRNKAQSVLNMSKGGGYWIWKYHIIYEKLKKINDNDILVYVDSGCTIHSNTKSKKRYREYINMVNNNWTGFLRFELPQKEKNFTNEYLLDYMSHYYNTNMSEFIESKQLLAGIMILRKNKFTMDFLQNIENLTYDNPLVYTDEYTKPNETHRHDQSIMSILYKYMGGDLILNDETWFGGNDGSFKSEKANKYPFWATRLKI